MDGRGEKGRGDARGVIFSAVAENVITRIRALARRASAGAKLRLRSSARITQEYIRDDNCKFVVPCLPVPRRIVSR